MKKSAIITGGSGDIGSAVCKALAAKGYNIIVNYNTNKNKADALSSSLRLLGCEAYSFKADVSNKKEVFEMMNFALEKFGRIDLLVNNAGKSYIDTITSLEDEKAEEIFSINLKGTYLCCKEASKIMIHQKCGKIINISSMWGDIGASCEVAYSASKAGINGLTKALAKELAPSGITVNAVSPGLIATKMNETVSTDDLNSFVEEIPLGRIGTVEDIAKSVVFLASDDADYITGQILSVSGGYVI